MILKKSDAWLKDAVLEELRWDSRVNDSTIGVSVEEGVVTLTGCVLSYAEKIAAQDAAHRVSGVLDVANDIEVGTPLARGHSDTDIAHAVRHTLQWNVLVPDERITSTVHSGVVTLEGSVDVLRERDDAERAVRHLAGVRDVENRIVVLASAVDTPKLHRAIEDALERRAAREAGRIGVTVEDGVVTVEGAVHSYSDKRAVLGLVGHARGVHALRDQLRVEP
jgi:osmotically-inducible protein OsmY